MWNGILPIGSIVLLKDSNRALMVVGQCTSKEEDDSVIYDYVGVLYPDGFEDPDNLYMFNKENIGRVYYIGHVDEKSRDFLPKMEETIKKLRSAS